LCCRGFVKKGDLLFRILWCGHILPRPIAPASAQAFICKDLWFQAGPIPAPSASRPWKTPGGQNAPNHQLEPAPQPVRGQDRS
jgi:hypothetical protein